MESNKLQLIISESGLDKSKADFMLENFQDYFKIAAEWEKKARVIVVSDETDKATMKMAREGRLFLRQKRIDVENARKKLKEQSLREGRAIDGIANVLKSLIEPIEEHLEEQEKFAERMAAQRKALLKEERMAELSPFLEYVPFGIDVSTMEVEEYQKILHGAKLQKQAADEAAAKAERERIEKERKEAEERERIRIENERLKKEAAKREAEIRAEREKAERERMEAEEKLRVEREAAAEALRKEREERERIEADLAEKARLAEKERKEKELAEKKAKAQPDKEKLLAFADMLDKLQLPDVKSDEALGVVENIRQILSEASNYIRSQDL